MKKLLSILVLISGVVLLTGCGNNESNPENNETEVTTSIKEEETKTLKCYKTQEINSVKLDLTYNITYKGDYVTYLNTVEKVISKDSKILKSYKEQIGAVYKPYLDIEYYENTIDIKGDTLTSTTNIDYAKIDANKLIEIDSSNKALIKDGKVAVEDLKKTYKSLNMTCE